MTCSINILSALNFLFNFPKKLLLLVFSLFLALPVHAENLSLDEIAFILGNSKRFDPAMKDCMKSSSYCAEIYNSISDARVSLINAKSFADEVERELSSFSKLPSGGFLRYLNEVPNSGVEDLNVIFADLQKAYFLSFNLSVALFHSANHSWDSFVFMEHIWNHVKANILGKQQCKAVNLCDQTLSQLDMLIASVTKAKSYENQLRVTLKNLKEQMLKFNQIYGNDLSNEAKLRWEISYSRKVNLKAIDKVGPLISEAQQELSPLNNMYTSFWQSVN